MKNILTILIFVFNFHLYAQEIDFKNIKVVTNTATFGPIGDDLQFNAYKLPNNSTSITRIEFEIDYFPPPTYDRNYANIIHTLMLWSYNTTVTTNNPVIEVKTFTTSTSIGSYTLIFNNLNIPLETNNTEYSFVVKSQLNDPSYNYKKTISTSKQFKFYRNPVLDQIIGNSIYRGINNMVGTYPYDPTEIIQMLGQTVSVQDNSAFSYQWQTNEFGNWSDILGATNESYNPPTIFRNTSYRRVITSSTGLKSFSNEIIFYIDLCQIDKNLIQNQANTICGSQTFYNLKHGDVVYPQTLIGSIEYPNGFYNREYGFEWEISYDNLNWLVIKEKEKIEFSQLDETLFTQVTLGSINAFSQLFFNRQTKINGSISYEDLEKFNYHPLPITYNINSGSTQKIYFRRKYYEYFYDCVDRILGVCVNPLGSAKWHHESTSNVVTIILTDQKPLQATDFNITSNTNQATCNNQQIIRLSMANTDLPNYLHYEWQVPSSFYIKSGTSGQNVKEIVISPKEVLINNAANHTLGGDVCVTVSNLIESRKTCYRIFGTTPFNVQLPTIISVCEGNTADLTPVVNESIAATNPAYYNYSWTAYNTPTKYCINPSSSSLVSCNTLRVKSENANFNPIQEIGVSATNQFGCMSFTKTFMRSTPGWQYGVLRSFSDPQYKWNSGLAYDASNNHLYYTANNNKYYRVAFNNSSQIWEYEEVIASNATSLDITGSVYVKNGATERIYFISEYSNNTRLAYIEKTSNTLIWNYNPTSLINNDQNRIKYNNGYIYTYSSTNREINRFDITTQVYTSIPNTRLNYSQSSFTVEEDVIAYADESNNIVALNTNTLQQYIINIPNNKKSVSWNSTISVYNRNIYYVNNGKIVILKRDASNVYSSFEEISYSNMEGNFTINKQTGTIYAKNYNGNSIYQVFYLNNNWHMVEIKPYAGNGSTAVTRNMLYANGHVYYLSNANVIANSFYIPPCYPSQLRQIGEDTGDPINDPLSKNEGNSITLSIYPNPASYKINLSYTNTLESDIGIRILDIYGKEVYNNVTYQYKGSIYQEILIDNLTSGLYIVELLQNNISIGTTKFIKQ
ncbi:MAG: T9SS type A sorting domain-containing protein [Cytophagaceae bacterium]|jgi:hypothetical protein|nr:T9SS type A sorting domain-containing protein [Cytophagaceae bacterium]